MESTPSTLIRALTDYAPYSYIFVVLSIIVWALIIKFIVNRLHGATSDESSNGEEPPS